MKKVTFMAFILAIAVSSGCSTSQKVNYTLDDIKPYRSEAYKDRLLFVKEFEDVRATKSDRAEIIKSVGEKNTIFKKDDESWYFNTINNYEGKMISPLLTDMMVKHINEAKVFSGVKKDDSTRIEGSLLLEGKIKEFWGAVKRNEGAEVTGAVGVQFGALGGLLSGLMISGMKSPYESETVLVDLRLTDVDSQEVLWEGTASSGKLEGEDQASIGGWLAYAKANLSLKEAVNKLLAQIAKPADVRLSQKSEAVSKN